MASLMRLSLTDEKVRKDLLRRVRLRVARHGWWGGLRQWLQGGQG
jgi:hypothetical protein